MCPPPPHSVSLSNNSADRSGRGMSLTLGVTNLHEGAIERVDFDKRCIPNPRVGKLRLSGSAACSGAGEEVLQTYRKTVAATRIRGLVQNRSGHQTFMARRSQRLHAPRKRPRRPQPPGQPNRRRIVFPELSGAGPHREELGKQKPRRLPSPGIAPSRARGTARQKTKQCPASLQSVCANARVANTRSFSCGA